MEFEGYEKVFENQYGCKCTTCVFYRPFTYFCRPSMKRKSFWGKIFAEAASWILAHDVEVPPPCYKCKHFNQLDLFMEEE